MRDSPRGKSRQTADMTGTGLRLELSSDDAIIGKTLDGIITTWNAGAERLYGYAAREVVRRPISIIIPPQVADELPEIVSRLKLTREVPYVPEMLELDKSSEPRVGSPPSPSRQLA